VPAIGVFVYLEPLPETGILVHLQQSSVTGHVFQNAFGLHPRSARGNVGFIPPAQDRSLDVRAYSV
jgi:hypothetical protein